MKKKQHIISNGLWTISKGSDRGFTLYKNKLQKQIAN